MVKRIGTIETLKSLISNSSETLYVRWSRGFSMDNKQGNSRDYANGGSHSGLSAVEIDPDWVEDEKRLARRITEYNFLRMKDPKIGAHIYSGVEVGKDSDGYELIVGIKPVATLTGALVKALVELKG